jgi:hypothetical protein
MPHLMAQWMRQLALGRVDINMTRNGRVGYAGFWTILTQIIVIKALEFNFMQFPVNISEKEMGVDHLDYDNKIWQNACKVAKMLQDIRDYYNSNDMQMKINVHVGYRDFVKNAAVGGVKTSQHLDGSAVDFSTYGTVPLHTVFNDIISNKIKLTYPISQIILEQSRINPNNWGWIHLGMWSPEWSVMRTVRNKSTQQNQYTIYKGGNYFLVNSPQPSTPV